MAPGPKRTLISVTTIARLAEVLLHPAVGHDAVDALVGPRPVAVGVAHRRDLEGHGATARRPHLDLVAHRVAEVLGEAARHHHHALRLEAREQRGIVGEGTVGAHARAGGADDQERRVLARCPFLDPDDARETAEMLGDGIEVRGRQPADVDLVVHGLSGPANDLSPQGRGHAVQPDEARGDESERGRGDADPRGGVRHRAGRDGPCEGRERGERASDRRAQSAQDEGHEQRQHHDEGEGAEHAEERGHELARGLSHDRDQHQVETGDQQAQERRVGEVEATDRARLRSRASSPRSAATVSAPPMATRG